MELFTQSMSAPGRDLGMCVVHSPGKWIGDNSQSNRLRGRKRSPAGFVRRCAFVVPVAFFRLGSPSRMRSEQIRAGIKNIHSAIRVLRLLGQSQACYVRLQPAATRERPAGALRSTAGQNGFPGSYCRFERRILVEASTPKPL